MKMTGSEFVKASRKQQTAFIKVGKQLLTWFNDNSTDVKEAAFVTNMKQFLTAAEDLQAGKINVKTYDYMRELHLKTKLNFIGE